MRLKRKLRVKFRIFADYLRLTLAQHAKKQ